VKVLIDTHVFLWAMLDGPRLSARARQVLVDESITLVLSVVSAWEIMLKVQAGKLRLPDSPGRYVEDRAGLFGMERLPIELRHVQQLEALPMHHKDPFDRLLVAQARVEGLAILTADPAFAGYDVEVVW